MTLSGCCLDQHSVQVYSAAKPRIITCKITNSASNDFFSAHILNLNISLFLFSARELVSKDYFIWNSTGSAPVSSGQINL